MTQETIVITGVTGQLGSYLAEDSLSKGRKVVGFSRRTASHSTQRIDHVISDPNFTYLEGDITDPSFLFGLFAREQPKYCVNTAAQSHVHTSFANPGSSWDITAKGALNVVDTILAASPATRLVHMSTSELFGDQYDEIKEYEYFPDDDHPRNDKTKVTTYRYQDENTRMNPQSPYAVAKLAAHHYVRLMRETKKAHLSSVIAFNYESARRGENFVTQKIVRWFRRYKDWLSTTAGFAGVNEEYIVGIGQHDNPSNTFPKLRLGNLDAYRDWSHARDVVKAVELMLNAEVPRDYVVGSGYTNTIREFLAMVCKEILDDDDYMKYVVIDPEFFRPAEVSFLRADPTKIKKELGWEPDYDLEAIVKDMCK